MLIRLLLWGLLLFIGYRLVSSLSRQGQSRTVSPGTSGNATLTHHDPVCGVYIAEEEAVVATHNGQRYYFCSHACLDKFRDNLNRT